MTLEERSAVAYARAGLPLTPMCAPRPDGRCMLHADCPAPGKRPWAAALAREPLRRPADVRDFWTRHPLAGIGAPLWAAGLVRLDVDGAAAMAVALRRGLPRPRLLVVTTRPGGGWHVFWRRQPGVPLAAAAEALPCGGALEIDSQGTAPLPPSRRRGGRLRWLNPRFALGVAEPPPAPAWAAEALCRAAQRRQARAAAPLATADALDRPRTGLSEFAEALLALGPAAFGGRYARRSSAVFAVECAAVRAGWGDDEALRALLGAPWVSADVSDRGGEGWLREDLVRARAAVSAEDRQAEWAPFLDRRRRRR